VRAAPFLSAQRTRAVGVPVSDAAAGIAPEDVGTIGRLKL
jgi:hypothetical protein